MATYSSAISLCYHLLVIFLLMCTILDVAALVDVDGEDRRENIIPPSKQKISYIKRDIDSFRYWATMHTAMDQADASGGDAKLEWTIMAAEVAMNEYVKLNIDGNASQADRDMAFRVLQKKVKPIEKKFKPPSDCQKLVEVGELFVEIYEKWNRGVLQVNAEIYRQLETALTNCTNLMRISYNRELTPQEMEDAAQMKKNLKKILGKSAGRLRGCLSLTLGAALLSTFLWLVGRRVFPGKSLDLLTTASSSIDDDIISEAIEYSKHSGTTGQATSSSSTVVPLLATVGLIIVIIGLLLYYFSDRIWSKKTTKKRRTTEKFSQLKTGDSTQTVGGKSSPTKCRESNLA